MDGSGGSAVSIAVALPGGALAAQAPNLAGPWEYRQANAARADGVVAEGERLIVVRQADGRLTGQYFGLERTGDHGLFYTAVDVGAIDVAAGAGSMAFRVQAPAPRRGWCSGDWPANDEMPWAAFSVIDVLKEGLSIAALRRKVEACGPGRAGGTPAQHDQPARRQQTEAETRHGDPSQ